MKENSNTLLYILIAVVAWYVLFKSTETLTNVVETKTADASKAKVLTNIKQKSAPGAVFYNGDKFIGKGVMLKEGEYDVNELRKNGIFNNSVSSIKVNPNTIVTVYDHEKFGGNAWTFTESLPKVDEQWNNRISSIVVQSMAPPGATFYDGKDFQGKSIHLGVGKYNTADIKKLGMKDDSISSIVLNPETEVVVYEKEQFGGRAWRIETSLPFVGQEWNNRISSIVIERK